MRTIWFLVALSVFGMVVALILPGWSELMLLAGPSALASIGLLLSALIHRISGKRAPSRRTIVVDGSNVLYWKDETPRIEAVREVVDHLSRLGFKVGVVFDANAGYLISGRYRHDREMGSLLGTPKAEVLVVPKGTPADPYILAAARDHGARIVTNDRYRDWVEEHPEIRNPGHLIRGGFRDGALWLDLGDFSASVSNVA